MAYAARRYANTAYRFTICVMGPQSVVIPRSKSIAAISSQSKINALLERRT
jgi:hypothetical protein